MNIAGVIRFLIALAFCIGGTPSFAESAAAVDFDAANKLYEQGNFSDAASAYEGLIQAGTVSAAVYFNLGNARFKAGDLGRAIAAYRQAQAISPRDADAQANLQFARGKVQGPTLPPNRWERWLQRLSVNEWTLITAGAFWTWLLLLTLGQGQPAWRDGLRIFTRLTGIAFAALAICLGSVLSATSKPTAVVTVRDAIVRNGPVTESPTAFTAHDGAELPIVDRKDNWVQVKSGERTGWLPAEQAVIVAR